MSWLGSIPTEPRGLLALALWGWLLAGCATVDRTDAPALGFVPLATDARIWLEHGAETYAERVGAYLDTAVLRVESLHGLAFRSPPKVQVCATPTCFTRWVKTPGLTAAVVAENRLVLSPRLHVQEAHRLSGILAYELSHLHLGQRLGRYTPWIPVWFHVGLAPWRPGARGRRRSATGRPMMPGKAVGGWISTGVTRQGVDIGRTHSG